MRVRWILVLLLTGVLLIVAACSSEQSPGPTEQPGPKVSPGPTVTPGPKETPGPTETPGPKEQPGPAEKPGPTEQPGPAEPPVPPEPTDLPTTEPTQLPPTPASAGVIRIYYYAHEMTHGTDPAALPGLHVIYSATSNDGINFTEDPGVRFSYDTGSQFGITDPDVVQMDDGSWLMFISLGQSLLKATSNDSSGTFTRDGSFDWNQGGVAGSYNFGGTIRTFTSWGDSIHVAVYDETTGNLEYVGVAIGPPASGTVGSPSLFMIDDTYYMVYAYHPFQGADPRQHEIYMAISQDGVTWSQHEENAFVSKGSVPGAVYYNNAIFVYYCGVPPVPGERGDMGVAVSRDKGLTFEHYRMIIEGKTLSGAVDPAPVVDNE